MAAIQGRCSRSRFAALALACLAAATGARASEPDRDEVAATVGSEPVYVAEARQVLRSSGDRDAGEQAAPWLQAQALEQVVNRQAAIAGLEKRGFTATQDDIDRLLAELGERLARRSLDLPEFLRQEQITEAILRRQLRWEFAWNHYLESQLTDEALEGLFNMQPREFDGSRLRVRHILYRKPEPDSPEAWLALESRAQALRADILAKKISFEAAAKAHSAGPSRRKGGDLGLIGRHGPMVEEFSRAAFELKEGAISEPVRTRFGVHLIQCVGIEPGKTPWTEARRELAKAFAESLFLDLARESRGQLPVKFTGAMPYLDASGQVVSERRTGAD